MRAHFGRTQLRGELDGVVVSEVSFAPWSRVEAHAHDTPQLSLVIAGDMLEFGDASGEMHGPNGACFRAAGYQHHNAVEACETRGMVIEMQSARWRSLVSLFDVPSARYVAMPNVPALYRRIRAELTGSDPASPVALESTLLAFVAAFARAIAPTPIETAKRLLVETTDPIAQIAVQCGFYDQAHFTRVFGREAGVTPARFRRSAHPRPPASSRSS